MRLPIKAEIRKAWSGFT